MNIEYRVYLGVGSFVFLVTLIYFFWAHEYGGAMMLFGTAGLGILPALYMGWWKRRMDPRPEDREDATLEENKGVIGAFPDHTIFPFVFGMGAWMTGLAFVFGPWTAVIGVALIVFAATSATLESRRGGTV